MKYTNIKSSNVEWLGDIPSHWEIKRGKNCLTLLSRSVLDDDDIITCFRDGEVTLRKNRREEGFTNDQSDRTKALLNAVSSLSNTYLKCLITSL